MKKSAFATVVFLALIMLGSALSLADFGGPGGGPDISMRRIDPSTTRIIQDYLAKEYQQNCTAKKGQDLPDACHLTKPIYINEALPSGMAYKSLPADIMKKISFVPPGAVYAQIGYTVYLIGWPRKIIYDDVTLENISPPPDKDKTPTLNH